MLDLTNTNVWSLLQIFFTGFCFLIWMIVGVTRRVERLEENEIRRNDCLRKKSKEEKTPDTDSD